MDDPVCADRVGAGVAIAVVAISYVDDSSSFDLGRKLGGGLVAAYGVAASRGPQRI